MKKNFVAIAAFILMLGSAGCFISPDKQYVAGDIATYKAIGPRYLKYIDSDATLSEDQKKDRQDLVESWKSRIEAAGGEIK
jgi:hypothetical protein